MPLIQGGPPQWIWERTPDSLKWEVVRSQAREGHAVYELRLKCGLEIIRCQFFTREELRELQNALQREVSEQTDRQGTGNGHGPSTNPTEPASARSEAPAVVHPGKRPEGVVSDPDFVAAP